MSLDDSDEKIALLKEIREEARRLREDVRCVRRGLLDLSSDTTMLDVARQNRFIVRHTRVLAKQHAAIAPRVSAQ